MRKQMTQNYFKSPIFKQSKVLVQRPPDIFRNVERSVIWKLNFNFIRVIKNQRLDQSFVYIWFRPFHMISCFVLGMSPRKSCKFIIYLRHEIF